MTFEKVAAVYDAEGAGRWCRPASRTCWFECDDVLVAVGQENAFPWIERDLGIEFDGMGPAGARRRRRCSRAPAVFFGGDAAFGPKNIIWAVAHGHEAAVSIDKFLQGEDLTERPAPGVNVMSQKMGIHEWSYDNDVSQSSASRCRGPRPTRR
jgi:formate dehydrogenase (NADP+) beta subunit